MTLDFLVMGCGSIGQRHIQNLRSLGVASVLAFDPATDRLAAARDLGAVPCVSAADGLERKPVAVLVCTPPHMHVAGAKAALEADCHVFLEKPISHSLSGVEELLALARERRRIITVGYNLRFHAGLQKLKALLEEGSVGRLLMLRAEFGQYLPQWRPAQDYRAGYNTHHEMGGGIILDGSHELDYVRWLGGEVESVSCVADHLSSLEMDAEDGAEIMLRMVDGVIAEIHLDCIQRGYSRNCKAIGEEGVLVWDFREGVRWLKGDGKEWCHFPIAPDSNEMYLEEMRHFLKSVEGACSPMVDGETGRRVLKIALAAKESTAIGREVKV